MQPAAPRLAPRAVTDLIDATFSLYRQNFALFAGIVAVLMIPETLLSMAITAEVQQRAIDTTTFNSASDVGAALGPLYAATGLRSLVSGIFGVLILGALSLAMSRRFLGQEITVLDAYRDVGTHQFLVLVGTVVLAGIAAIVYLVVVVLLGVAIEIASTGAVIAYTVLAVCGSIALFVFVGVRLVFVAPVVVIERAGVFEAFRRSWWLAKGYWWRIVGLTLLVALIVSIVGGILGALAAAVSLGHPVVSTGLSGILTIIIQPVQYCALTLLYYDQRIRKEGFDLEYAAQAGTREAAGWAPPASF
jgi:hypothetical protein